MACLLDALIERPPPNPSLIAEADNINGGGKVGVGT